MTEFERAKKKQEKEAVRKAKYKNNVVPIAKKEPNSISVTIVDDGRKHEYTFLLPQVGGTRLSSQRNYGAYREALEGFIHKEFGKWQLVQTP